GTDNLRSESPIIIGAYTFIPTNVGLTDSAVTANYQFALDEFTTNAPGGGLQNGRRKIAMVACSVNAPETYTESINHLIDVVQVPAVIAPLPSADLVTLFDTKGRDNGVFFLSPVDADSSLVTLEDDGLVWNILGRASDLASAYVPLLDRTEAYIRAERGGQTDPIRVALITDETRFQRDISDELTGTQPLFFNGQSASANFTSGTCGAPAGADAGASAGPCFMSRSAPSDPTATGAAAAYTALIGELAAFRPDVIVSTTGYSFVTEVMEPLENYLEDDAKPFYLMGPYHADLPELRDAVVGGNATTCNAVACPLSERVLGINFESSRDPTLVESYRLRFGSEYPQYNLIFENFYDSAWYMFYALAAAGNVGELTGADIRQGMRRLVWAEPTREFGIGDSDVSDVLYALGSIGTNGIQLDGTMGLPDFDPATGARNTLGSAFCFSATGTYMADVLRYDASPAMTGNTSGTCVPAGF
ncbi:MAG TPA: hypothetical protein VJU61_20120, partial [Polyangiaceae bacterium]|nr:hypothetical protein [Polyangiaceae bacterium]